MLNLLKSELRLIAKKGSISGYKSMSKIELINAINTSEPAKSNKKNIFKSKRKEIKNLLMKSSKKKVFKSKIKEIREILCDPILDRDRKIEEIKKNFMIQKIIFLNQKKIIINQQELVMLLVATTLNIKIMEIKIKLYQLNIILMKLNHT